MIDWREHLSSDPKVCQDRLCAKGTRVLVTNILEPIHIDAARPVRAEGPPSRSSAGIFRFSSSVT